LPCTLVTPSYTKERVIQAEIDRASREKSIVPERRKIAISDQKALLNVDPRKILTGEIEIYDDRAPRPR
jgi:hypothetical protein